MPDLVSQYMTMMHENFELQNRMLLANSSYEHHLYNLIVSSQQATNPPPSRRTRPLGSRLFNHLFQDVVIRPNANQIATSTREILYGDISTPPNTQCPITQEAFNIEDTITQILHCRHCFNSVGINRWWRSSARCPVCRYDIRDYTDPAPDPDDAPLSEPISSTPSSNTIPSEPTNLYNSRVYNMTDLSSDTFDIYLQLLNTVTNITDTSGGDTILYTIH